jgi:hypothetical protein
VEQRIVVETTQSVGSLIVFTKEREETICVVHPLPVAVGIGIWRSQTAVKLVNGAKLEQEMVIAQLEHTHLSATDAATATHLLPSI